MAERRLRRLIDQDDGGGDSNERSPDPEELGGAGAQLHGPGSLLAPGGPGQRLRRGLGQLGLKLEAAPA
jgi:hypothetical protein